MAASYASKIAFKTLQTKAGWYVCNENVRYFHRLLARTVMKLHPPNCIIPYWQQACRMPLLKTFTTGKDEPATVQHKIKTDPRARRTIGSIGRKISHRIIHVIDENGENLGNRHRADVIRMMDERGIKIVPLNENADPPVYKLMTGKQIHEEQMKLREKQKNKLKTGSCITEWRSKLCCKKKSGNILASYNIGLVKAYMLFKRDLIHEVFIKQMHV
ncbi:translation initiation factor IF-3, mitochondrial isoform X3 [Rhinoraja longicauda]